MNFDFDFDVTGFIIRNLIGLAIAYAISYYKAYKVD